MSKLLIAVLFFSIALVSSPGLAQQTAIPSASTAVVARLPAVRHLVYQFGYNTQAASQGNGTGTTTITIVGLAKDGGMTVTATDDWWNSARPHQANTCEVYPNGGVTCPQAPYALSPIQGALVPLLGQHYFAALSAGPHAHWTQTYNVRASFFPSVTTGFVGQVYTWNCESTLTGKGPATSGSPLILIQTAGTMKQIGGRAETVNQEGSVVFDPHLQMPVLVNDVLNFVPQLSVNRYTVQLKLTNYSAR